MKIRHLSSLHKISAMNSHVWSVLFDVYMTEIVLAKHRLFSDHNVCRTPSVCAESRGWDAEEADLDCQLDGI